MTWKKGETLSDKFNELRKNNYNVPNDWAITNVEEDIKKFIKLLENCKICSECKRYDCGHDDWMMVSLNNIKRLTGSELLENHSPLPSDVVEDTPEVANGLVENSKSSGTSNSKCANCGHDIKEHQKDYSLEMLDFCAGNNYECKCKQFKEIEK